ncbi:MAG: TadE/TadG family type IV pilus assembly protein [Armatimonadota bacterium]|nr:TadE/TadG family type IV pilus assembly protein [Armatimonadota bacterium]
MSGRKILHLLSKRLGQSIIEFAFVLTGLVLLIIFIIGLGILFSWLHTLNNAARAGARLGATCRSYEAIVAEVRRVTRSLPNAASVAITVTPQTERIYGQPITVALAYITPSNLPFIGGRTLRVRASYTMECTHIGSSQPTSGSTCSGTTCSGATCSGSTCSGATCSGPTCSGATCSGSTCTETCAGSSTCGTETCSAATCGGEYTCDQQCGTDTARGCRSHSHNNTCGNTCRDPESPSGGDTCGGMGCRNTVGHTCMN